MRRLTLRQFRVFDAVARHLSFSRAAEELHLSQPAVSMQVRGIETILGMRLTEQLGKKIFLTEAGREVLHASQAITARLDDLQANLAQLRSIDSGQLNLAATSTVNVVATDILARFRGRHPGVSVHLDVSNRAAVLDQLVGNRIDLAIMGQVPDGLGLEAIRFMDNPLVVIAPPDHPLVRKSRISVGDLAAAFGAHLERRLIAVRGDLTLAGPTNLGSAARPVIVVVDGDLTLRGEVRVHGLLYARRATWNGSAGPGGLLRGALIAEAGITVTGAPDLVHDAAVLASLRATTGSFVRVHGSWRDF